MKTILISILTILTITSCTKRHDGCYHCEWKYNKFDSVVCGVPDMDKWIKDHTPVGSPKDYIVCKD